MSINNDVSEKNTASDQKISRPYNGRQVRDKLLTVKYKVITHSTVGTPKSCGTWLTIWSEFKWGDSQSLRVCFLSFSNETLVKTARSWSDGVGLPLNFLWTASISMICLRSRQPCTVMLTLRDIRFPSVTTSTPALIIVRSWRNSWKISKKAASKICSR